MASRNDEGRVVTDDNGRYQQRTVASACTGSADLPSLISVTWQ